MIIISQNCLAANLYRHHIKEAFPHPFVYCVIDYTSMSNLIRSWNDIDFHKYDWLLKEYPILLLEHDIKIQFVHYTSTHDADEKYNKRLSRMQLCNYSNPFVCYMQSWHHVSGRIIHQRRIGYVGRI